MSAGLPESSRRFLYFMPLVLTHKDYAAAAKELKCSIAAIRSVFRVESREGGFDSDGRLIILFERHKFYQFTKGKFSNFSDICNPKPGGYTNRNSSEWNRLEKASLCDSRAATLSTSWGRPQIMGFNANLAGYISAEDMVADFDTGEPAQLAAFVRIVKVFDLDDELQRVSVAKSKLSRMREWHRFARVYNGKNYEINKYPERLEAAFVAELKQPTL
jgi:hypothetical protein